MTRRVLDALAGNLLALILGEEGVVGAILRPVPGTRASWEFRAPFEASDPPRWGEG